MSKLMTHRSPLSSGSTRFDMRINRPASKDEMTNKNEIIQAIKKLKTTGSSNLSNLTLTIDEQVLDVTVMRNRPNMLPWEVTFQQQQLIVCISRLKDAFPEFKDLTAGLEVKYTFTRCITSKQEKD